MVWLPFFLWIRWGSFFSKSDVQCFQKDEVCFVHVSYYNFDVRGLFRLYKSTLDFFLKEKKIPPIQIIVYFCSLYMDTLREGNDIVSLVVYMDHIGSYHLKKSYIFFLQCYLKLSYFHTRMNAYYCLNGTKDICLYTLNKCVYSKYLNKVHVCSLM